MSLGNFGAFGGIIQDVQNKSKKTVLKKDEIDQQFTYLEDHLNNLFFKKKYSLLFNWITESVKNENELATTYKYALKTSDYNNSGLFRLLIYKTGQIHAKIIELVIDDIFVSYMDYIDYMKCGELDLAIEIKISVLNLVNDFTDYLTENKSLNAKLFDTYINQIYEAQEIFNI